nr:uncharacterized protein LOC113810844 isoform X1 [Penaeus vannamei]XP_027218292.1 uncharacterized protein LOC113810844 isoform X2 [Penaeus vannamei]XP_027218293.1 uncharacterized protein LOC113810844 isoform X2 [Penaeus vannamei]
MYEGQHVQVPMESFVQMPQGSSVKVSRDNSRHDPDDRYCTKQVVVQLFVLGLLLLAVALGAFLASVRFCRLGFENSCYYGYVTASNIGVAAVSAGGIFMFLAIVGYCSRCCNKSL